MSTKPEEKIVIRPTLHLSGWGSTTNIDDKKKKLTEKESECQHHKKLCA